MKPEQVQDLLTDPVKLDELPLGELEQFSEAYPWFVLPKYLLAKKLRLEGSDRADDAIAAAAILTPDRAALYRWMEEVDLRHPQTEAHEKPGTKAPPPAPEAEIEEAPIMRTDTEQPDEDAPGITADEKAARKARKEIEREKKKLKAEMKGSNSRKPAAQRVSDTAKSAADDIMAWLEEQRQERKNQGEAPDLGKEGPDNAPPAKKPEITATDPTDKEGPEEKPKKKATKARKQPPAQSAKKPPSPEVQAPIAPIAKAPKPAAKRSDTDVNKRPPDPAQLKTKHSFNEWLKLMKPVGEEDESALPDKGKSEPPVIDKGSEMTARLQQEMGIQEGDIPIEYAEISADAEQAIIQRAQASSTITPEVGTETLARIYTSQGKIDKAMAIYEHLRLTNPEKSGYFAALIENLK